MRAGSEMGREHLRAGLGGHSISKQLIPGNEMRSRQTHMHKLDLPALPACLCHRALWAMLHLSPLPRALQQTTAFNSMPLSSPMLWFPNHPTLPWDDHT